MLSPDHDRSFARPRRRRGGRGVHDAARPRARAPRTPGTPTRSRSSTTSAPRGASIAHPHAQVFALDAVPAAVARGARTRAATRATTSCVDDAAPTEPRRRAPRRGSRVWCPYASTSPYLVRVAHDRAGPRFDERRRRRARRHRGRDCATRLTRLGATLGDPPYNVVVHTAPPGDGPFHWYVEIVPRLSVSPASNRRPASW